MKALIRHVVCTVLLALSSSSAVPADNRTVIHMQQHLARLGEIKAALLVGDLDRTRQPATWLAEHEPFDDLPVYLEGFVLSMREHAREVLAADDVDEAATAMAAIANDCGACHRRTDAVPSFDSVAEPPAWSDLKSHMQRHGWAVDRLWEGLTGPSDKAWARGIRMMAEAPLNGTENTWGESAPDGDALAIEVHELAMEAVTALTPAARGAVFADMVAACAACHLRTGGGPRPD